MYGFFWSIWCFVFDVVYCIVNIMINGLRMINQYTVASRYHIKNLNLIWAFGSLYFKIRVNNNSHRFLIIKRQLYWKMHKNCNSEKFYHFYILFVSTIDWVFLDLGKWWKVSLDTYHLIFIKIFWRNYKSIRIISTYLSYSFYKSHFKKTNKKSSPTKKGVGF